MSVYIYIYIDIDISQLHLKQTNKQTNKQLHGSNLKRATFCCWRIVETYVVETYAACLNIY